MSYADQVFISMCEDILENGTVYRHIWDRKRHKRTWRQQEFAVFNCEATANSVTGHVCVNTNLVRKM